jgi:arylsulfatase A-like enzyme
MGRLLASIPDEAMNNTIVIFIGDNGTPGQIAGQFYGSRGAKGGIFEGGTHVPLIVSGPGVKAGRSEALVGVVDLFATISGLAGEAAATSHSIDFRPVLEGGEGARNHAYVEHFSNAAPRGTGTLGWAIRDERYKLVEVDGEPQMLFDLELDPFEENDLLSTPGSDDMAKKASELRRAAKETRG